MSDVDELRLAVAGLKSNSEINERRINLRFDQLDTRLERRSISPGVAAVIAALLGLVGVALGAFLQGRSSLSVEQLKFESTLILDALKAESQEEAAKNLDFLVKAKLIDGRNGAIERLARQPADLPIRTLETRLRALEAEVSFTRCVAQGGVIDFGTLECHEPAPN